MTCWKTPVFAGTQRRIGYLVSDSRYELREREGERSSVEAERERKRERERDLTRKLCYSGLVADRPTADGGKAGRQADGKKADRQTGRQTGSVTGRKQTDRQTD